MSSRLDICRRNLLLRKAMDIGGMMNIAKIMKTISPLLVALIAASASASPVWKMQKPVTHGLSVFAETKKSRIAVDAQGVAIQGYDPVAYFKQNKPGKASPKYQSVYQGAKFYFVSAADKKEFDKTQIKYAPTYSGYSANTLSKEGLKTPEPNAVYTYKRNRSLFHT